ncbi:hypothetical protein DMENIID0001_028890 [Sergentomyia squamirostris]
MTTETGTGSDMTADAAAGTGAAEKELTTVEVDSTRIDAITITGADTMGKDNAPADALSRIEMQSAELKSLRQSIGVYWNGEDEGLEVLCEVLFKDQSHKRIRLKSSAVENQEWFNQSESEQQDEAEYEYSFSSLLDLHQVEANSYGHNRVVVENEDCDKDNNHEIISIDNAEEQEEACEEKNSLK